MHFYFKNVLFNHDLLVVFIFSVSAAVRKFSLTYNSYISGSDNKVLSNSNPESCASTCLSERGFICRSFGFDNSSNTCRMSTKSTLSSALERSSNNRFYELSKWNILKVLYIKYKMLRQLAIHVYQVLGQKPN